MRKAALLALVLLGASCTRPTGQGATSAERICRAQDLRARVVTVGGAGGNYDWRIALKNASSRPCAMGGWPSLELFDGGHAVPTMVKHGVSYIIFAPPAPRLVDVRPGRQASFDFSYQDGENPDWPCRTATTVKITPPGDYGSLVLSLTGHGPTTFLACSPLTVTPVYPGTGRASKDESVRSP